MPELPEVETTVRGLEVVLVGQRLARVEARRADLRRVIPADLRQRLTGAVVTALHRRAKYGLIDTDRGDTLVFHLGMSGRWLIDRDIGKHDHLIMQTDTGTQLALCDPRRFGSLDLVRTDLLWEFGPLAALGPEPLGDEFATDYLRRAFAGRAAPIKSLLLDQRIVAGLGNIYVCEALHIAGILPTRPAGKVSRIRLKSLVHAVKNVLSSAILAGGSTLRDYASPNGELGYFFKQWRVYGREGLPCSCGKPVLRKTENGRSTFYCACCQK